MPSVIMVRDWYTQSCKELLEFSDESYGLPESILSLKSSGSGHLEYFNLSDSKSYEAELQACNDAFVTCIDHVKKRHSPTTQKIATGVLELKEHWKRTNSHLYPGSYNDAASPIPLPTAIQSFLDNFYMSRIGIRMLIGQHIAISQQDQPPGLFTLYIPC